ncbi:MAG: lipoprotein [Burkholderiaceae bacterium]|jgi:predicted small lipoprotein YifL|nr:lipoprotein [Burkholderiaceae bacterium]
MSMQPVGQIILVTGLALVAAALSACGQRGPLYLPDAPAARQRATLPQTVFGGGSAPEQTASAPVPTQTVPALSNLPPE